MVQDTKPGEGLNKPFEGVSAPEDTPVGVDLDIDDGRNQERPSYATRLAQGQARQVGRQMATQAGKKAAKAATKAATRAAASTITSLLAFIGPWLLVALGIIIVVIIVMIALCKVPVASLLLPYCDDIGIGSVNVGD